MESTLNWLELNNDTITFCRAALELNWICFIIDERGSIDSVIELSWINIELNNYTIVFCRATLQLSYFTFFTLQH